MNASCVKKASCSDPGPVVDISHGVSTLVLKPYFSQSLSLHSHLFCAQAHLKVLITRCLAVTGGGSVGECGRFIPSPPIPLRLYTLSYWCNPPFLISDIRALWRSVLSARAPECQKIKNGGLHQYGAEPFEQQQFGTAGVERVKPVQLASGRTIHAIIGLVILACLVAYLLS